MNSEQSPDQNLALLHQKVQDIWNQNAAFWDEKMGEGNDFQRILVGPSTERLLDLQAGELVLEVGCGNGVFARRIAQLGVQVIATDFSENLIERAKARTIDSADRIEYHVVDATDEGQLLSLGENRFDGVVCNMAMMDMTTIEPLMRAVGKLLSPKGRFVFSVMHPCFNSNGALMMAEEEVKDGDYIIQHSIRVSQYLNVPPQTGTGMAGQPVPHYYFHRPLHVLLGTCFRAGLVMDGIEEPAFNHPHDGSQSSSRTRALSWVNYKQIPPVLVVRMSLKHS